LSNIEKEIDTMINDLGNNQNIEYDKLITEKWIKVSDIQKEKLIKWLEYINFIRENAINSI